MPAFVFIRATNQKMSRILTYLKKKTKTLRDQAEASPYKMTLQILTDTTVPVPIILP